MGVAEGAHVVGGKAWGAGGPPDDGGDRFSSKPWIPKVLESGTEKFALVILVPSRVSAAGSVRVTPNGATRYCSIFLLPLGKAANAVICSTCTAVDGGLGVSIRLGAGLPCEST